MYKESIIDDKSAAKAKPRTDLEEGRRRQGVDWWPRLRHSRTSLADRDEIFKDPLESLKFHPADDVWTPWCSVEWMLVLETDRCISAMVGRTHLAFCYWLTWLVVLPSIITHKSLMLYCSFRLETATGQLSHTFTTSLDGCACSA